MVTGTDPLKDNKKLKTCKSVDPENESAQKTADIINALSDEIRRKLKLHEINIQRRENG